MNAFVLKVHAKYNAQMTFWKTMNEHWMNILKKLLMKLQLNGVFKANKFLGMDYQTADNDAVFIRKLFLRQVLVITLEKFTFGI